MIERCEEQDDNIPLSPWKRRETRDTYHLKEKLNLPWHGHTGDKIQKVHLVQPSFKHSWVLRKVYKERDFRQKAWFVIVKQPTEKDLGHACVCTGHCIWRRSLKSKRSTSSWSPISWDHVSVHDDEVCQWLPQLNCSWVPNGWRIWKGIVDLAPCIIISRDNHKAPLWTRLRCVQRSLFQTEILLPDLYELPQNIHTLTFLCPSYMALVCFIRKYEGVLLFLLWVSNLW